MKKKPESLEQTDLMKLLPKGDNIPISLSSEIYYKTLSGYAAQLRAWPDFDKPHSFPAS